MDFDSQEQQSLTKETTITNHEEAAATAFDDRNPIILLILQPYQWIKMLSHQLNPTFILGVVLVYGFSQGFSGAYFRVVGDYYWKEVQRVQPSVVQLYIGFYYIPWIMKPLWGLLTDVFPVLGYRRRPYFIAAGVIGGVSASVVAVTGGLPASAAVVCLVGVAAGMAIGDVTIDACIAKNSVDVSALASDMQSLCGFCSSVGALIGYSTSGLFVHQLGPQDRRTGALLLSGHRKDGLYQFSGSKNSTVRPPLLSYSLGVRISGEIWHKRLDHCSLPIARQILHQQGLPCAFGSFFYDDCPLDKARRLPFKPSQFQAS